MNLSGVESASEVYKVFESHIRQGLKSLIVQPLQFVAKVSHEVLPGFQVPVEEFEIETDFPGARCLITFGKSAVDASFFYSAIEFSRPGKPTLFLDDYLASRKDPRAELLQFSVAELTLEEGIQRIVEMLIPLLNDELRPLLEGRTWLVAPFNWGDYK